MIIDIKSKAINSLAPNAQWAGDGEEITWLSSEITQPTDAEIQAEVTRLQTEYDSQAYARERKARYDLLNQDELRFDDLINGTTTWQDAILAIKQDIPK